jgi:hypothetical protein
MAVPSLEKICLAYVNSHKTVENVCAILEHAHLFHDEQLEKDCLQIVWANPTAVLKSAGIKALSSGSFEKILEAHDDLSVVEEVIFDAMLVWADSECQRRGLNVSGDHRRTVIGPLLYRIRFHVMDKTYFKNVVAPLNILSPEEKKELLQYHFGTNFVKRYRRVYRECLRFGGTVKKTTDEKGWYRGLGQCAAISFTASEDISLCGVLVYDVDYQTVTVHDTDPVIVIRVYDQYDRRIAITPKQATRVASNDIPHMYKVILPEPQSIHAGHRYTVKVEIVDIVPDYNKKREENEDGCEDHEWFGTGGMTDVTVGNVSFHFIKSKRNTRKRLFFTSSVEEGQIPGLLFR